MIIVGFKKLSDTAIPFKHSRDGDACMDMYADEDVIVPIGFSAVIPTNIAVEIPSGYEGIVRGRSGLAAQGIMVHTGTIDETYRGSVGVIVSNHSSDTFKISKGNRIAQFTVKPVLKVILKEVEELSSTERGTSGYGSSGI